MRRFLFHCSVTGLAVATMASLAPLRAWGQSAHSAANAASSIVPVRYGFFTVDFAEIELGLTFVRNHALACGADGCSPSLLSLSVFASAAARKWQRNLFTKLDFTPGFDIGVQLAYVARQRSMSHDAVFLRLTYSPSQRDIITVDPTGTTATLGETSQRTFAAAVGFNHAFSEVSVLGVALEGRRELSSPGVRPPREFCTPGNSPAGFAVLVCSDRFVGPLDDLWRGQARIDLSVALTTLGTAANAPRLGMTSAASVDITQGSRRELNLAAGPALHLRGYAGMPLLTILFGVSDVLDDRLVGPDDPPSGSYLGDHLLLRLAVAVPFEILVGK